jgi:SAM-dependent methyltransferase
MKKIFEDIITHRRWQDVTCGSGSTVAYTEPLRQALPGFLEQHNITSMLDAPCGDYSWMKLVEFSPGFKYQGGDIVEFMIEQNKKDYPDVDFRVFDLTTDPIPDVDMLFCRDCLFHLSLEDIDKVLDNIARSSVKYVMITSHYSGKNRNIQTGDFRSVDFTKAPYNFETPIDSIEDWIPGHLPRRMSLWPRSVIERYFKK